MNITIELDREEDGRWIAEAMKISGAMCYGQTRDEAISNVERLVIEVIADRIAHNELSRPHWVWHLLSQRSTWPASKAKRVRAALQGIGWQVRRQSGSHRFLERPGWPDHEFAFHDKDEIGPRMLAPPCRSGDRA